VGVDACAGAVDLQNPPTSGANREVENEPTRGAGGGFAALTADGCGGGVGGGAALFAGAVGPGALSALVDGAPRPSTWN
jgi:hypothetical protein